MAGGDYAQRETQRLKGITGSCITAMRHRRTWSGMASNLNTHGIASLYAAFPPEEALRLSSRLEIHYTPKHGSWLNIAEIELSALSVQCLDRRFEDITYLASEVAAWEVQRNARRRPIKWQFKTADARIKLKSVYPQF